MRYMMVVVLALALELVLLTDGMQEQRALMAVMLLEDCTQTVRYTKRSLVEELALT